MRVLVVTPGYPRDPHGWPPSALIEELSQRADVTVATWHFPSASSPYRQGRVEVIPLHRLRALPLSLPRGRDAPHVVHCLWGGVHAAFAAAVAAAYGAPLVLSTLGGEGTWDPALGYGSEPGSWRAHAVRLAMRRSRLILAGSQRQLQEAWSVARLARTEILPVGVDPRFTHRISLGERASGRLFCAASLVPVKGHELLLRAMAALPPRFGLTLAGDGPLRSSLESLAASLKLSSRVRFLGAVPLSDMPELLGQASIVASASSHEGGSVALLEALATGRPVVSTAAGAAPELLAEGAGLIARGEPEALAQAVLEVDGHRSRFDDGAKRAGDWVREHWTHPRVAARLMDLYDELVADASEA